MFYWDMTSQGYSGLFETIPVDRNREESSKRNGRWTCRSHWQHNRWCTLGHVIVKECVGNPDIELLVVGLCPYYLLKECLLAIFVTDYIPRSFGPMQHRLVTSSTLSQPSSRQNISVPSWQTLETNHVTLDNTLINLTQFVECLSGCFEALNWKAPTEPYMIIKGITH